eukprot:COSAG02_NODE_11027_length_1809_cov_1.532164_1_plen_73_part_10
MSRAPRVAVYSSRARAGAHSRTPPAHRDPRPAAAWLDWHVAGGRRAPAAAARRTPRGRRAGRGAGGVDREIIL